MAPPSLAPNKISENELKTTNKQKIGLELSEGKAQIEHTEQNKLAVAAALPAERLQAIIKRLPAASRNNKENSDFNIPFAPNAPPKPGKTLKIEFPPKETATPPSKQKATELKVLSHGADGSVANLEQINVSFSEAMVPLGAGESEILPEHNPIQMTPLVPGKWRWLGTQTLSFTPEGKHLPKATAYKFKIPEGTSSINGAKLAKAVEWTISTPPAQAETFIPSDEFGDQQEARSQATDALMFAKFDQKISASDLIKYIHVSEGKFDHSLQLATEQEIKASNTISAASKDAQKSTWIAFKTSKPFNTNQKILVKIGPGTPSAEGSLQNKSTQTFHFRTYAPLSIDRHDDGIYSSQAFAITFNNPLDAKRFKSSMVSLSPAVSKPTITVQEKSIIIYGQLRANTTYSITMNKDIADTFGQKLGAPKTVTVKVLQFEPNLQVPESQTSIVQPTKHNYFSVLSCNVPKLRVSIYEAQPKDYKRFLKAADDYRTWFDEPQKYKDLQGFKLLSRNIMSIPKLTDQNLESRVDLSPFLKAKPGHLILTVETWPRIKDHVQRFPVWVQCTNIGLDAFTDGSSTVAMATRLDTGEPIHGAQISKGQLSSSTDKNGIARFEFKQAADDSPLICKSGSDQTFLADLWAGGEPPAPGSSSEPDQHIRGNDTLRWYTVTDRNLYRPAEKVQLKGWFRFFGSGAKGDLSLVANSVDDIEYKINDGNGLEIGKGTVKPDELGGFNFSFDIPKNANLGDAIVNLQARRAGKPLSEEYGAWSQCNFKIEEFRRPEFELTLKSSAGNSLQLGEATNITASANYFAGGPLAEAAITWSVRTQSSNYDPPGWQDYKFGKGGGSIFSDFGYWRPNPPEDKNARDMTFKGTTDGAGRHVLELKVNSIIDPTPVSIVAEGTVSDVNRQEWSDKATLLLHPAEVYVGLRPSKQFFRADEAIKIDSIVTDLDGKASSGRSVHLELVKETASNTDSSSQADENNRTKEEKLASTDLSSDSKPVSWSPVISSGGIIKVLATVTDEKGRKNETHTSFWREETKPDLPKKAEKGKILVIADHKEYKVGDTAELNVQVPFTNSRGVLTVRHNGISSAQAIVLEKSAGTIKLPITEDLIPNAFIQLDLVGANCQFASGSTEAKISADSRRLKVEVEPATKAISPGSKTTISLKLKDARGQAVTNSQVAIAVVDESVLALSGYKWNDPISVFYADSTDPTQEYFSREHVILPKEKPENHPADLLTFARGGTGASPPPPPIACLATPPEAGSPLRPRAAMAAAPMLKGATNGSIGPDSDQKDLASKPIVMRTDFSALAYFNPALNTDAAGNLSCEIQVPDNLTRYRVMAAAISGGQLCGQGESSLTARLPLMVRPSAPRFLNFGDRCELPVVLQNQTDQEMSVDLGLRASNLKFIKSVKLSEPATVAGNTSGAGSQDPSIDTAHLTGANVLIPPNDRVELRFPANTEGDGTATIDIAGSSSIAADAASVSLPVYTPATSHSFATYGQIDEGANEQVVDMPKDVFEQVGGLELSTSSTALQALTDAYMYLISYSFLCSEQLSSRTLGATALLDVLKSFNKISDDDLAKTKTQIQADLKEMAQRQNSGGDFGLWKKGGDYQWPFVSIQVSRALSLAKSKGFDVADNTLSSAQGYLKTIEDHLDKTSDLLTRRSISAYALYVRYLMGDKDPAKARNLIHNAIESYSDKNARRDSSAALPNASAQDKVLAVLPLEALGWLLPVISGDKDSTSEIALLRGAIAGKVTETASRAEFNDDAYKANWYYVYYSDTRLNAVMLEALMLDQPDSILIPKLANTLLARRKAGRWNNTQENFTVLVALDNYFNKYEKQTPDFIARSWLGNNYVGETKFAGRSTDTQVINVPVRFLQTHPDASDLFIAKEGAGRLYYRVAFNYAPKELLLDAYDNGFSVTRSYEAVENPSDVKKDNEGIWHIKSGATVKVKIEITVPEQRYHVALTDPLPAGMEPVNAALAGTRTIQPEADKSSSADGLFYYPWWRDAWFEHQNLKDFRAEAFSSYLWGGKYNYSYIIKATTPGVFIVPPSKIEEMYAPETFGRAASDRVVIE